ncbi:lipid A-modifier LpxR family protein [Bizionia sp. KMM 8389]
MIKKILLSAFFLSALLNFSQENVSFNSEIELATDNDFFVIYNTSDRNYTYGVSARYRWKANETNFISGLFSNKLGQSFIAGANIEAYTPNYRNDGDQDDEIIERPYAGWSYIEFHSNYIFDKSYLNIGTEIGILGRASQAGALQNYFHENISGDETVDWSEQLPNQFGINILGTYAHEIYSLGFIDTYASVDASIGNINTYLWPKISFRLGQFNKINASIATQNGLFSNNKQAEWFVDYGAGFRISGYNATIQGNIFNSDLSRPKTKIDHYIFTAHAGVYYSYKRFALAFNIQFNTGEFDRTQSHSFGSLKLLYRFDKVSL